MVLCYNIHKGPGLLLLSLNINHGFKLSIHISDLNVVYTRLKLAISCVHFAPLFIDSCSSPGVIKYIFL